MIALTAGWATDVGRVRAANEDACFVGSRIVAVADGMGGHAAGEVASRLAVEAMRALDEAPGDLDAEAFGQAIADANAAIVQHGRQHRRTAGMGTTLCGVGMVGGPAASELCVFNIGDSRVYRLAEGTLRRASIDHSEVEELQSAGLITADEARTHPLRNIVTRCLGMARGAEPDASVVSAVPGDRWVLCSDGLNGELTDAEIAEIVGAHPDPQQAADALVAAAVEAGGRDNVTVIVADVTDAAG